MRAWLYGGVALAMLGLGAWGAWQRGNALAALAERDKARAETAHAVDANRTLDAALKRAQAQAAINDRILLGVSAELAKINATIAENTAAVTLLGESNEEVRAYLGTLVPDALELQLNR